MALLLFARYAEIQRRTVAAISRVLHGNSIARAGAGFEPDEFPGRLFSDDGAAAAQGFCRDGGIGERRYRQSG